MVNSRCSGACITLLVAATCISCAADSPAPPPETHGMMLVQNQSQFDLLELRFHTTEDYNTTDNVLSDIFPLNESVAFYSVGGGWYVTVFREHYERGPILALTTASPIEMVRGEGLHVSVFDEYFRLKEDRYVKPEVTTSTASSPTYPVYYGE